MEFLAEIFVGQPLNILVVAVIFLTGYLTLRFIRSGAGLASPWLLRTAFAWTAYAAWEWLVLVWTPEADIRVDLLVIWPALALLTAWALFQVPRLGPE
jgi:hypothetical protein